MTARTTTAQATTGQANTATATTARTLRTKGQVARCWARHSSGYVLGGYWLLGALWRHRQGPLRRADLRAVVAVVALQPFFEWALHRFVLHGRARSMGSRVVDLGAAHRGHHAVPDDVGGALLGTGFAVSNGAAVAAVGAGVGVLAGGTRGALAAAMTAESGLLAYEWLHLLSHSGYQPRTAWFRHLRAGHLRHHFRDEGTNFGVTSRLADRLLRTAA
ncbi:MAG: sterol desaturase family protein [Acidimicrobiales bacterium]